MYKSGMATVLQQKMVHANGAVSQSTTTNNNAASSLQQARVVSHEIVNVSTMDSSLINISNVNQQSNQNITHSSTNRSHNQTNNFNQLNRFSSQLTNNTSSIISLACNNKSNTSSSMLLNVSKNSNTPTASTSATITSQSITNIFEMESSDCPKDSYSIPNQEPNSKSFYSSEYQESGDIKNSNIKNEYFDHSSNIEENAKPKNENNEKNGSSIQNDEEQDSEPEIDIVINNVVCSFSVRCHLNLREIALNGFNVEFRRENGMVTMRLRRPYTTASIWSSGRITCTGATSEEQAKIAARRYSRCLQKLGFSVRFQNFRVVNVLGTCSMPWGIRIVNFSEKYRKEASYEPELHPGVTYKLKYPKATLKIFSTGSITVTAGSVAHVQSAIEHIFPLVYEFRKKRTPISESVIRSKDNQTDKLHEEVDDGQHNSKINKKLPFGINEHDPEEDVMYVSDYEEIEADDFEKA